MKVAKKKHPKMVDSRMKIKHLDEDMDMMAEGGIIDKFKNAFSEDKPKPKASATPAPSPRPENIKKYGFDKVFAKGGMVDEESSESPEHEMFETPEQERSEHEHKSIADAIMARRHRKMLAEGGMVDIHENAEEESANPSPYDEDNMDTMEHDFDSTMDGLEQPEDSNEHSIEIDHDEHDMAIIRRRNRLRNMIK